MNHPRPISHEELDELAGGTLIEIPHWKPERTMWVRIRYVDLTPSIVAAMEGKLFPNPLRDSVEEAFEGQKPADTDDALPELSDIDMAMLPQLLDSAAREALIEPSYEDLEARELKLTMSQKLAIFTEVMGELDGLESFRALTADVLPGDDSTNAPVPAE